MVVDGRGMIGKERDQLISFFLFEVRFLFSLYVWNVIYFLRLFLLNLCFFAIRRLGVMAFL